MKDEFRVLEIKPGGRGSELEDALNAISQENQPKWEIVGVLNDPSCFGVAFKVVLKRTNAAEGGS